MIHFLRVLCPLSTCESKLYIDFHPEHCGKENPILFRLFPRLWIQRPFGVPCSCFPPSPPPSLPPSFCHLFQGRRRKGTQPGLISMRKWRASEVGESRRTAHPHSNPISSRTIAIQSVVFARPSAGPPRGVSQSLLIHCAIAHSRLPGPRLTPVNHPPPPPPPSPPRPPGVT